MLTYIIIVFSLIIFYLFMRRKRSFNLNNEHCLVTGGSSGIGLEISIQAARMGANVTIIARSKERLEIAKEKILSAVKNEHQKIQVFSVDIIKEMKLAEIFQQAESSSGPISLLINCAGTSISSRFEETPLSVFQSMFDTNVLGSVNVTQAVLPLMKERKRGHIVFVSSLAGLVGLYGYTAYSASKFAIRGFAESLQMEVKMFNINITVSFPPDTDTPGFAEENKSKPLETARISESGGLYSAEEVARQTLDDIFEKKFMSTVGFEGWVICTVCSGMAPVKSFVDLVFQVLSMSVLRLVSSVYLLQCDQTIKKCAQERQAQKNTNKGSE